MVLADAPTPPAPRMSCAPAFVPVVVLRASVAPTCPLHLVPWTPALLPVGVELVRCGCRARSSMLCIALGRSIEWRPSGLRAVAPGTAEQPPPRREKRLAARFFWYTSVVRSALRGLRRLLVSRASYEEGRAGATCRARQLEQLEPGSSSQAAETWRCPRPGGSLMSGRRCPRPGGSLKASQLRPSLPRSSASQEADVRCCRAGSPAEGLPNGRADGRGPLAGAAGGGSKSSTSASASGSDQP